MTVVLAFLECISCISGMFLHFWNVSATFRIWQKEPVSQIGVTPFSSIGNRITFGLLQIRCLFYIWNTLHIAIQLGFVLLKIFSHLSHSCFKTHHNSVVSLYFQPKWFNFFSAIQKRFGLWPKKTSRPHPRWCYYFASYKKHVILLHLAWLNSKKLDFTQFLLYFHKGLTAALAHCL